MLRGKKMILAALVPLAMLLSAAYLPAVEVGEKAPDFELTSTDGGKLKLSSLRGKNVLINFYTLDFSPA